ncbi:hypothetical protein B7P43_G10410 [Cryptotermes secundus]|uniref:Mos1 transposase HTH domain-containing protein n=1 Tax=Cryptotermes secundus TaxID=105785 RepID=A0A2J7QEP1_9NEOP|nr:hypothetical protein B7P43_G10410 [Cryptotermes secundus]
MSFRLHAVIEFLVKEEIPAAEIHQRLQRAYESVCMGASSVRRWVKHFKDGNTSIEDVHRTGRPRTASIERNKERVDEIIQDDRHVTVDTITRKLGIGHSAVQEMIESLDYRKVCARWVPRLLTEDHKGQRKAITSELLQIYRQESNYVLLCIVTGDESCKVMSGVQAILATEQVERDDAKCSGKVMSGVQAILATEQVERDDAKCSGKVMSGVQAILATEQVERGDAKCKGKVV